MRKLSKLKAPRMTDWLLVTVILLMIVYQVHPQSLPNVIYKLSLVTMASVIGYWIDRSVFPYARPDSFMEKPFSVGVPCVNPDKAVPGHLHLLFAVAMLRRAIIIVGCMLAASLGL